MARLGSADPQREQRIQAAILDGLERRFAPRFARSIAKATRAMADDVAQSGAVPPVPKWHIDEIAAAMDDMAVVSVRLFAGRILRMQRGDSPVVERKDFAETMRKLAFRYITQEMFRRKITFISNTTRAQIVRQVERGYADGLGQQAVAKLIREAVPSIARARSAVIARTETHGAAGYGAHGAAEETGLTLRKEWIAAEDERTRESHADLNGTVIEMDAYFDVNGHAALYPGDPSLPPEESVNCRCVAGYIAD